ncbi:amt-3 [Symbiodinium sp. CCMP2592]|nr:amt-3 [Symbiodinium sp. CCMP2592]
MGVSQSACRASCCQEAKHAQQEDRGNEVSFPARHFAADPGGLEEAAQVVWSDMPEQGFETGAIFSNSESLMLGALSSAPVEPVRSKVLDPDMEMLRGISLSSTLLGGGHLWRYSPQTFTTEQRMALYKKSKPMQHLDMFISHTWWTAGWRKAVALYFQSTASIIFAAWLFCIFMSFVLCITDVLPLPFVYQANLLGFTELCPMGCWILCSGLLGPLLASVFYIYLPCCTSPVCFVDVACIHQADQALMQRGVQGIGGFLAVTRELRVLWSPPYLSRLWCIFELAAFRKANPEGKITLKPLFVEMAVLCIWVVLFGMNICFFIARSGRNGANIAAYTLAIVPFPPAVYVLRKNYLAKKKLLVDMEEFDLNRVSCYNESDREFIHSAISDWYGSAQAFTRFVQGPLRRELVAPILATNLPWSYIFLIITPTFSLSMETLLALWKGGAPVECLIAWTAGMLLGNNCFFVPAGIVLMLYLCDRFAAPVGSTCLAGFLQSLAIVFVMIFYALVVSASSNLLIYAGVWTALVWLGIAVLCFLALTIVYSRRRPHFVDFVDP